MVLKMEKETKFCSNCGAEIDKNAEICPKCGVRIEAPPTTKNPLLAAILSFLCAGLGQIYNKEIGKGIIFISIEFISLIIMAIAPLLLLLFIPFWIYAIFDAYKVAEKITAS